MDLFGSFPQLPLGPITLTLFAGLFLYICVKNYVLLQYFKRRGIPGPKPTMFVGHSLEIFTNGRMPHETIASWIKEYGNVFGIFFGPQPLLVINDPDILKDIMIRHFNNFANRTHFTTNIGPLSDSIILATGNRWRTARHLLTPAFSSSQIKLLAKAMNEQTDVLVQVLQKSVEQDVNVVELFEALTLDILGERSLAISVNCQMNSSNEVLLSLRNFFKMGGNPLVKVALALPYVGKPLIYLNNYLAAGKVTDMIVSNVKDVIAMRRKDSTKGRMDLLQLLLDAEVKDNDQKKTLTHREIIGNVFVFLMAGLETTANSLGFTLYLLAIHPDIQDKLYQSIMHKLKDVESPTYEEVFELTYLDQVLKETLRLYPPIPNFLLRKANQDIQIGKVFIPKDVVVHAPVWQLHHDPGHWSNPEAFDPERFSPENKANIKTGSFLPFGIGPRNCIGFRFAQLEMKLAVIKVLKSFQIVPSAGTEIPLQTACKWIILNAKNGVTLKLLSRVKA